MLQWEHSAILLTFIKLPFVIKIIVLSIFEWPFYTGFTVNCSKIVTLTFITLKLLSHADFDHFSHSSLNYKSKSHVFIPGYMKNKIEEYYSSTSSIQMLFVQLSSLLHKMLCWNHKA